MLGYRGCSRYLAEPDLFALEVEAIQEVRRRHSNLWAMFPFVRTVEELRGVKNLLKDNGLQSSQDFKVWMMLEVPSNVLLLDEFLSETAARITPTQDLAGELHGFLRVPGNLEDLGLEKILEVNSVINTMYIIVHLKMVGHKLIQGKMLRIMVLGQILLNSVF